MSSQCNNCGSWRATLTGWCQDCIKDPEWFKKEPDNIALVSPENCIGTEETKNFFQSKGATCNSCVEFDSEECEHKKPDDYVCQKYLELWG